MRECVAGALALCLAGSAVGAGGPSPLPAPAALDVCDVLARWQEPSTTTVRVRGSYTIGFEKSSLTGPGCAGQRIWVSLAKGGDPEIMRELRRPTSGLGSGVNVVLEGYFRGPVRRPDGSATRYGHLGGYAAMLEVTAVHNVGNRAQKPK